MITVWYFPLPAFKENPFNTDKLEVCVWYFGCEVRIAHIKAYLLTRKRCHRKCEQNFFSRPGMLWGLLALRPGDRLFRCILRRLEGQDWKYMNVMSVWVISRVQDEPLDSILDAWRLLCHTYGRWSAFKAFKVNMRVLLFHQGDSPPPPDHLSGKSFCQKKTLAGREGTPLTESPLSFSRAENDVFVSIKVKNV